MKPSKDKANRMHVMHLWSWDEVVKAIPYMTSIVGSLREHWLDVLTAERAIDKAADQHGPATRKQMIDQQTHQDEKQRAQVKFDDALEELTKMDVFLLDPIRGLALIPHRHDDELAWYIFDHFTPRGCIGWRYHSDPMDQCRPLETETTADIENSPAT